MKQSKNKIIYQNKNKMTSKTLDTQFKKKRSGKEYLHHLKERLEKMEWDIYPLFKEQFQKYKLELLALVAENISTVEKEEVQAFIATKNKKINTALWFAPVLAYENIIDDK